MKDVINAIELWQEDGAPVALATVVQTWGSAPRQIGAKMALTPDGRLSGSVSGGCVEGAVFDEGVEALAQQRPRLLHFGVADETAWDVGLACGGTIEVFVEPLDTAVFAFMRDLIQRDEAGAAITVIRGPEGTLGRKLAVSRAGGQVGTLGDVALDEQAAAAAQRAVHSHREQLTDEVEVFLDVVRPAPRLVMVGGVHIAVALTSLAKTLGYHTTVVDPRRAFGSVERFPHVEELIQAWPDEAFAQVELTPETAVALLTHDPKIDDPALKIILEKPVFYVGALGSRKTHAKRVERLRGYGFSEAQIARIHGPIGLDIGASTPEEIALSILAQIVKIRAEAA
ncbi:MAG: XdhC family protein [Ardenticatenaceae bacterium]|nr:XdhC family protein [Ardenticatenaceae bacterium]